jgi:hypothetical protein
LRHFDLSQMLDPAKDEAVHQGSLTPSLLSCRNDDKVCADLVHLRRCLEKQIENGQRRPHQLLGGMTPMALNFPAREDGLLIGLGSMSSRVASTF